MIQPMSNSGKEDVLQTAINTVLPGCTADGPWRRRFVVRNGSSLEATLEMAEGWVVMSAPLGGMPGLSRVWALAEGQSALPPFSKILLQPASSGLMARAEARLEDTTDAAALLGVLRDGLGETCARYHEGLRGARGHAPSKGAAGADIPGLVEQCAEAGWPAQQRAQAVSVELDAAPGGVQAMLAPLPGARSIEARYTAACGAASKTGRTAAALLLLYASEQVRMIRPFAHAHQGHLELGFAIRWPELPGPAAIHTAMAALSVSCRLFGRELNALLTSDDVAGYFLAVHGWQVPSVRREANAPRTPRKEQNDAQQPVC